MRVVWLAASLVVVLLVALSWPRPQAGPANGALFVFAGATVVSMDRDALRGAHDVVVRDGRIAAVVPSGRASVPPGATVIDARGKYLLPGLADMHVHFNRHEQERDMVLYLANGVTTVRNMHAAVAVPVVRWRDELAAGRRTGPTLYTTGPTVRSLVGTPGLEWVIRRHQSEGYDFIKVYSDLPADAYARLTARARAEGIPVVGHVPVETGLAGALEAGQSTFEHVEDLFQVHFRMRMDDALIPDLVATFGGHDACVAPTLVVFANVVRHFEQVPDLDGLMAAEGLRFVGPKTRADWSPANNTYVRRARGREAEAPRVAATLAAQYAFKQRIVVALAEGGVTLLAASDANVPHTIPGFSLLEELEILVGEVGLSPAHALATATVNAARCMGKAGEFGVVAAGARADLLLLDADPLADIGNLRRRVGVMVRGEWFTESDLQSRLHALSAPLSIPESGHHLGSDLHN